MTEAHKKDDIRGNLVLKIGEVKEEKTYFKLRIGNNPEDVSNMKAQIKDECGHTAESRSLWAYFGSEMEALTPECKFKTKDGGVWVDLNRAKIDNASALLGVFPSEPFAGELFVEMSMTSDKTFKCGFYNSFNYRVSLDGSHEFAQNFGLFLVKFKKIPIHEKLLLNIIKKFSSFDIILEFDTLESLNKEVSQELLFDDKRLQTGVIDLAIDYIKSTTSAFADTCELASMVSKGVRIVAFINSNMYVNIEIKGEDALHFLQG